MLTLYDRFGAPFHRRRLWASAVAGVSFLYAVNVGRADIPGLPALAVVTLLMVLHPIWRLRRPRVSALETVLLDTSMILVFLAVLRPPLPVLGAAVLYMVAPAVIFLAPLHASWAVAYAVVGSAIVRWAFPQLDGAPGASLVLAALVGIAALPPMTWLTRTLIEIVAEGRRTAGELAEADARFERLFQHSVVPMFRSSGDGLMIDANQMMLAHLRVPDVATIATRPMASLYVIPEDRARMADIARREGQVRGFETQIRRWDGDTFWARISVTIVATEDGIVVEGVMEDVTESKSRHRQALEAAAILGQVQNGVVATDLDGRVRYWNAAAERIYGWSAAETLGRSVDEFILPVDGAPPSKRIATLRAGSGSIDVERDLIHRDGHVFPGLSSIALLYDEEGAADGAVSVVTDITERRMAQQAARTQGELARSVLDSLPSPVAVLSFSGEITTVNEAWEQFAEANGGDARRTGVGVNYLEACEAATANEPELMHVAAALRGVLAGQRERLIYDYACHAPDVERWFRMEATPVSEVGAVVAHWDVTSDRRAQRALEELVESKDEFLAALAHHLRTPLTAVVGFAEHLRSSTHAPEEQTFIELMAHQAAELADLVEDLLLVGRLDSGTIAVRPTRVMMRPVVERAIRQAANGRAAEIVVDVDDHLDLLADDLRVQQVLRHLVSNAVRHGRGQIEVRGVPAGARTRVCVIDHGDGLADRAGPDVFALYAHGRSTGQPGTVGLGLHIARQLARLMAGELTYRREGEATVFELDLPAAANGPVGRGQFVPREGLGSDE